ncbi:hypothetical protein HAT2_00492 [Candidatus Similichlamydia laticola]|uniref:Uncharacterized protein n=2 Tax=Candidatus Similichlamydia laticola TaxID=2170265 RepID=A0A369KHY4_9BACT|nr:hypothetical protein HAT2_00492 [Candidatus Similichlamydia laticola]
MKALLLEHGVVSQVVDQVRFAVWEYALLHTSFSLARQESKDVLKQLQMRGLPILGVSRRSFASSCYLPLQLRKLGIDLFSSLPPFLRLSLFLSSREPCALLTQGILFMGSLPLEMAFNKLIENVSLPLLSVVCISSDKSFLEESFSFFNAKKAKGIYAFLSLEEEFFEAEDAKFQLLSIRSVLEDHLVHQFRDPSSTFSDREVVRKIRDIWEMCSG